MKSFFESLAVIFGGLFFGTMIITILTVGRGETVVIVSIIALMLIFVGWQGWISLKELRDIDKNQNGISRILGILVGLFVWYFSCGGLILGAYF